MLDIAVLSVATQNDDHLRLQNKTRQAHVHFQLQGSRELSYILHDNLRSRLLSPSRKVTPMAQPPRRVSRRRMEEWRILRLAGRADGILIRRGFFGGEGRVTRDLEESVQLEGFAEKAVARLRRGLLVCPCVDLKSSLGPKP